MTPEIRAMNGVELAIRRVADSMRGKYHQDPQFYELLDMVADELSKMTAGAISASRDDQQSERK